MHKLILNKKIILVNKFRDTQLSKVYLVNLNNKKHIQKTIHIDFISEFYKQKYLSHKCKRIKIPKIYSITKRDAEATALMEYIPHVKTKLKIKEILSAISIFHKETENVRCKYFKIYSFNKFYSEVLASKEYLPQNIKNMTRQQVKEFFKEVFNSKYSIVHGDFHADQAFKTKNKYYLIDFVSSFYGPSILDYAYFFREYKRIGKQVLEYLAKENNNTNKEIYATFIKSLMVILIFDINWFINRRKYEHKLFKNKINKATNKISHNFKKLKQLQAS